MNENREMPLAAPGKENVSAIVKEKLKLLPASPGVYIMKDASGRIIYVGKAVVLKNRVRQYFQNQKNHAPKVRAMVARIADFETIMTASEVEALILENNLIKKHRPRYNIDLKDDKTYPYVKVTLGEAFPRLVITRRLLKDKAKYFGPYADVGAMHESLKLLRQIFFLRTCKQLKEGRPCLEYHIKRCLAPCIGGISAKDYGEMVNSAIAFLEGRTDKVERKLKERMEKAAAALDFEAAAKCRDQLKAVRRIAEKQNAAAPNLDGDRDAIALARQAAAASAEIMFVRSGKLVGRERFNLKGSDDETDAALLLAFLQQYYHRAAFIPKEILLPFPLAKEEMALIAAWLTKKREAAVSLTIPRRGPKRALVEMAQTNAQKYLADLEAQQTKKPSPTAAVDELQDLLSLPSKPRRIECFDISHIQGKETVASLVTFIDGEPEKSLYRRYKLKLAEGTADDFLALKEVMTRRYGKEKPTDTPDLVVIDGGKGQLHAVLEIIRGAGHTSLTVIGLAKRLELVYVENNREPIALPRKSAAFFLLERVRDEAHRFAIKYHRTLRSKRNLVSVLDHISGIGQKRRQALWSHFGSLEKIKAASAEDLAAAPGMTKPAALAVAAFFAAIKKNGRPN